ALAVSAILSHYGYPDVPVGLRRPITNDTFFDAWTYKFGEFASKVAFHWSNGTLPWGDADKAWEPLDLYRKMLAEQEDGSVTIASIGFLENVCSLDLSLLGQFMLLMHAMISSLASLNPRPMPILLSQ